MPGLLKLDTSDSLVPKRKLLSLQKKLSPKISQLQSLLDSRSYSDDACSILLPDETAFLSQSHSLAKKIGTPKVLVIIGIGGSNLGTMAVQEAVLGKYHNLLSPRTTVLYADTCDPLSLRSISELARKANSAGEKVVLNLISKSGSTTESIANFEYLLSSLTYPEVVITTDSGSPLHSLASGREDFHVLPIPKRLGGRYSVFSNVGLFPLSLLGIDTHELLTGAKKMRAQCLSHSSSNPASQIASILYSYYYSGIRLHDSFLFSPHLESAGKWHRQLLAESLGKEKDAKGKRTPTDAPTSLRKTGQRAVHSGITPTVSIGSTDLHSMAQLYLAGPNDKLFRFVNVAHEPHPHPLPRLPDYDSLAPNLAGRTPHELLSAIFSGTLLAFRKRKRPFFTITLPDRSARSLGALLQLEMLETIYLAHLMGVNPFGQPAVEEYKREVRSLLSRKRHFSR